MKKKTTKLTLAKETLRSLEHGALEEAKGALSSHCSRTDCESVCDFCTN
ncbi:MAG TPA: class I lanthipeptide [Thermoanaerobaculia bacterium]|nr:class I lanthipeptide [Thermoanaerobaculia bacterium]